MRKASNIICGIYCIENKTTKKKYIGQSKSIYDRWSGHKGELRRNCHDNDYLQKAWNKYGEEDFDFYILEHCDESELNDRERYYIDFYNTTNRDCGYNLKSGGQDYSKKTEDAIKKQSEALKKMYNNPEARKRQSENAFKQWANPEIKAKILGENNGMYGKHHTEEAKQKMREAAIGRPSARRNRSPVLCQELNKIFEDAATAAKELMLNSGSILEVCRGKRKSIGGYHWSFLLGNNIS